jgi:hypothetical protein
LGPAETKFEELEDQKRGVLAEAQAFRDQAIAINREQQALLPEVRAERAEAARILDLETFGPAAGAATTVEAPAAEAEGA